MGANYDGEHVTHNSNANQILSWYGEQVGHCRHLPSADREKRESMPGQTLSYRDRWSNPLPYEIGIATEAHFVRQRIKKFDKLGRRGNTHKNFSKYSK